MNEASAAYVPRFVDPRDLTGCDCEPIYTTHYGAWTGEPYQRREPCEHAIAQGAALMRATYYPRRELQDLADHELDFWFFVTSGVETGHADFCRRRQSAALLAAIESEEPAR